MTVVESLLIHLDWIGHSKFELRTDSIRTGQRKFNQVKNVFEMAISFFRHPFWANSKTNLLE